MKGLLDPKTDFIFKKIFGSESNKNILISFLNATLKSKDEIKKVTLDNTDIEKNFIEDKFSRLDIKATTNKGEKTELVKISSDKKQRAIYEMRQKALHDEANALYSAKIQGIEQGIEQGKLVAVKAFLDVFDNEEISKRLNINIDIVAEVRKNNI